LRAFVKAGSRDARHKKLAYLYVYF